MDAVIENVTDGVFTIMLNRPEKKNAMSLELLKGLSEALERAEVQGAAVIVIRGAGKTFCAGGDILEFRQSAQIDVQIDCMADYLHRSIRKIREINAIVIAVVEGLAFGAGLSLSLACDLTVAEMKATMKATSAWSDDLYQWVHVEDVAHGLRQAMEHDRLPATGVYTLGAADTRCPEPTMEILHAFRPDLAKTVKDPQAGRWPLLSIGTAAKTFGYAPKHQLVPTIFQETVKT